MKTSVTNWPPAFRPEISPVHTHNELEIPAPPEIIWAWLVRAEAWPLWYANSRNVVIENGPGPDLSLGTVFSWTTFGVRVRTKVEEFVRNERLAWSGTGFGAAGYHAWVIEPLGTSCRVVTEETQHGVVPGLFRVLLRRGLLGQHQKWLEGLAAQAQTGKPS